VSSRHEVSSGRPAAIPDDHAAVLSSVIHRIATARRLNTEDAREFSQTVHLKMLERNYAAFSQFEGRSSLATFLTSVVERMLKDWRNEQWGKWRTSAAALRLGPTAVLLERLIVRDGLTSGEAVELVAARPAQPSRAELERLTSLLPSRVRRQRVSDDLLIDMQGSDFHDPIEDEERRRHARVIRTILRQTLAQLSQRDQWLLHERYLRRRSVAAIAKALSMDAKALYRYFAALQKRLRQSLVAAGVAPR
jgi:RNA polymerase sigma factor (sigma-70 family)